MKLLSDDEFLGGSAAGGSTLLSDDQFMGGATKPAQRSAAPTGEFKGLLESGNIDLAKRPVVKNADGTISTVRSMSFSEKEGGPEILIPTVSPDGKILSNQDAIKLYRQTGQHLGVFDNADDATAYAEALHGAQADFYTGNAPASGGILSDDEFLNGAPAEPPGFLSELKKGFVGSILNQNPQSLADALDAGAELTRPSPGTIVGSLVRPKGEPVGEFPSSRLGDAAATVRGWAQHGAEDRKASVPSFTDIRTDSLSHMFEDAASYAGYGIGSGAGSSTPSIVVGASVAAATKNPLGFFAGALGPSYAQNLGDTYATLRDDPGIQQAIKDGKLTQKRVAAIAAAVAVPIAALDAVSAEKMIGINLEELKGGIIKRVLKKAGIGALTEGGTEGLQQVIQESALKAAGGDHTLAQSAVSVIDNAVQGALSGGAISTAAAPFGNKATDKAKGTPETGIPQGAASADTLFGQESADGPPPPSADTAAGGPPPPPAATSVEKERPNSPRLTPADRASPLPNDLIDDGKKIFDEALGAGKSKTAAPLDGQIITPAQQREAARRVDDIAGEFGKPASQPASSAIDHTIEGTLTPAEAASAPVATPARVLSDREFLQNAEPAKSVSNAIMTGTHPAADLAQRASLLEQGARGVDVPPNASQSLVLNAPASQRTPDALVGGPEFSRDVVKGLASKGQFYSSLDVPSQLRVLQSVLTTIQDDKVFRSVVDAVPVDVMNKLFGSEAAAKLARRDKAMFVNALSSVADSLPVRGRAVDALIGGPAFPIAESGFPDSAGRLDDAGAAMQTSEGDGQGTVPSEVASSRTTPLPKKASPEPAAVDVKQRRSPSVENKDIVQFIAGMGGIRDYKGELRSMDLSKKFVPGMGKLVRESGSPADTVREAAAQEGYFDHIYGDQDTASQKSTVADLYRLIDDNERGNRRFTTAGQRAVEKKQADKAVVQDSEEQARQDDFAQMVKENGLDDEETAILQDAVDRGEWASEAVFDILERRAVAFEGGTHDIRGQGEPNLDDIPFDIPQAPDTRAADAPREGSSDQGRDRQGADAGAAQGSAPPRGQHGQAERDGRAPEGGEGKSALKTETVDTQDGKREQTVIPGAERISQKTQAQREADKPLRPKAPQKDAGELFDSQARSERQDELFALRREGPRQQGIPASAVSLAPFEKDADIKAHPDYRAAKDGDNVAAVRLVQAIIPDSFVQQAADSFGSGVIYAAVGAQEAGGRNKIPAQTAAYLAERTGATATGDITQTNKAFHTGARPMERLLVRANFDGEVVSGGRYVIVDDATVMGSTLADMADHIQHNGGKVVGIVTLANASRTGVLVAPKHRTQAIERRFGDVVRSELHLDPASLTAPEAGYLLNFRDADALRSGIAKARNERVDRLRAKGIQQAPEDHGEGQGRLKRPNADIAQSVEQEASNLRAPVRPRLSAPTDAFKKQAQDVGKRLRAELDRLGLKDVGLRIAENLGLMVDGKLHPADGAYFRKLISVALDADNPDSVLDHEAIHALRDVGAFSPDEWAILERKSRKEWRDRYGIADAYGSFPDGVQIEEGIAHAYADWRAGRSMDGIIAKAFKKIRGILQAIGRAFGKDFRTAEDVFGQVASGEIGNQRDASANPVGAGGQPMFQSAWHGTPHDFDQFSLDHIGKGEGAQAYGWGLYFAGKKQIAEYYREKLAGREDRNVVTIDGREAVHIDGQDWVWNEAGSPEPNSAETAALNFFRFHATPKEAATTVRNYIEDADQNGGSITLGQRAYTSQDLRGALAILEGNIKASKPGRLFKVDLPEDSEMLDWDKPISEQPEGLLEKIDRAMSNLEPGLNFEVMNDRSEAVDELTFSQMYKRLQDGRYDEEGDGFSDKQISEALRAAGIPGHKYLDNTSRTSKSDAQLQQQLDDVTRRIENAQKDHGFMPATAQAESQAHIDALTRERDALQRKLDKTYNYVIYDDSRINVEERFKLRSEPQSAEDRQKTMQGMIARGQPLDRALRLPFQFFGGVDEKGRWKPGLHLSDKAAKIITTAKIDPQGRFGWLAGPVEAARAGLIDRYGLSPEYIDRDRQRQMDERSITMRGAEVLKTLADQNVGTNEARVLQAILTGEAVSDKDMNDLAAPIRQAIDELGQEAVSLGLVSAESFERNRGAYLHRVYAKHESEQNNLQKLVSQVMGRKRKQIIGDELKGRGLFWDVDNARLMRDIASFKDGKRGGPVLGEKFRVLDNVLSPTKDMLSGEERGKVARRVYVPADHAAPAQYVGPEWRDNGVWEVRKAGKDKVTLWRDYSQAERTKMGEILDARYTIGKTYLYMAHDLATGRFYKDIAENEDWTSSSEPAEGTWTNPQFFGRASGYGDKQWVRVPDEPIPSTGGKKKWGALSGRFVRAEIWRDLNEIDVMNRPSTWRMLLTQWKKNKTMRNPVTHMNNVMSNFVLMDMQDIRMQDLAAGLRSFINKDQHWQDANEHGVFGSDMMTQEIRDNVLKPILAEIEKQTQNGVQNSFLARVGIVGKFADRLWSLVKTADQKMLDLYRVEDDVFRMASYQARLARGESPKQAAANAREQFLDYSISAPWVNAARNSVLPFISYIYRAAPLIARAMATRPWKLAKYAMVAYALNALAYAWDDDGDEDKERASLRDEEQGYTWIGSPRMLRMPWRDAHGLPVFLDIRRWIPGGDVFDTNQGSSAVPIPAPLQFGGPLMMGAEIALNKQGFTGDPIRNELTDDWWDATTKVGDYLWKGWLPSAPWVPGSWYYQKISNAISGATDVKGRAYSVPQAVSSSLGVKVKSQDVEMGIFWHYKDLKDQEQDLRAQARQLARQRDRGLISQKAFDRGMVSIIDKVGLLKERANELQRVQKK